MNNIPNSTEPEICPCIEFSKDNGKTWETWVYFHLGQVGESRACYGRLSALYPEYEFRVSAGIMGGGECRSLVERNQDYERHILNLEKCLQWLAEKCEAIVLFGDNSYQLTFFDKTGNTKTVKGERGETQLQGLLLAIEQAGTEDESAEA